MRRDLTRPVKSDVQTVNDDVFWKISPDKHALQ